MNPKAQFLRKTGVEMVGVREHGEGYSVALDVDSGRIVVIAENEAGCNDTRVDLQDLLDWVNRNRALIESLK